jgi:hypothetical protein
VSLTALKVAGWAFGEILTSAQMNHLNTDYPTILDGAGGGDYAPTAPVRIDGSGFTIGTATGKDTPFITANARWAAAAIDVSCGPTVALRFQDVCCFFEGKFIAACAGAADKIALSLDDGWSWRDISSNIASPQTITLACCEGKPTGPIVLAGGNSAKIYSSADAVTWTFLTAPGSPTQISRLFYHSGLDLFVAIGHTAAAPYIASITTGLVATSRTVPASITGVQNGDSIAMATSGAHSGRLVASWDNQTKVAFSDDATTWTASTTSLTSSNYLVAFGAGFFVAVNTGGNLIYRSSDGDTWSASGLAAPGASLGLTSLTCLNGVFVATSTTTTPGVLYVSTNAGVSWRMISAQYLGYTTVFYSRAVQRRLHILNSDGTNSVDLRGHRLGFNDGTA